MLITVKFSEKPASAHPKLPLRITQEVFKIKYSKSTCQTSCVRSSEGVAREPDYYKRSPTDLGIQEDTGINSPNKLINK